MECSRCLSNQTIQSLSLDTNNICQFCKIHDEMDKEYPLNDNSEKKLFTLRLIPILVYLGIFQCIYLVLLVFFDPLLNFES